MSGIAAIFNRDGAPVDRGEIDRMLAAIAHRGPDGLDSWARGPAALGHAAFHTTPESLHEVQPLFDDSSGICLTFDGRIDNRDELGDALRASGARLTSDTDAEMVLRAYQVWGEDCAIRLIGDFALVIWDQRKRMIFAARDAIGVRTFHYLCDPRCFVAGSEPRQIVIGAQLSVHPNEGWIAEYLSGELATRDETPLRGVMTLPPSHCLTVSRDRVRIWQYFDIDPGNKLKFRDDREYADAFLEVFTKALTARMRANGIIGTDLSGGLDSSSIASLARKLLNDGAVNGVNRIEAFYLNFPDPESDERKYVKDVVEKWKLPLHMAEPTLASLPECVAEVRRHFHLPSYPNGAMARGLMREAAALGIRAHLGGSGGDEWLYGSTVYVADALKRLRVRRLIRRLKFDSEMAQMEGHRLSALDIARRLVGPLLPEVVRSTLRRLRGKSGNAADFLEPNFIRSTGLADRIRALRRHGSALSLSDAQFREGFDSNAVTLPLEMEERMSVSLGIESRYPFNDRRVIEYVARIPEEQRFGDRRPKEVLRNAMVEILPDRVRNRLDKGDYSNVFVQACEKFGSRFFESMEISKAGWVKPGEPARMYRESVAMYHAGDRNFCWHIWPLAGIAQLEIWLRVAVLGQNPVERGSKTAGDNLLR